VLARQLVEGPAWPGDDAGVADRLRSSRVVLAGEQGDRRAHLARTDVANDHLLAFRGDLGELEAAFQHDGEFLGRVSLAEEQLAPLQPPELPPSTRPRPAPQPRALRTQASARETSWVSAAIATILVGSGRAGPTAD